MLLISLITSTIDTVQHRLRREYMRCQFHQDTHRYYDDMCIAFHQDAYSTIENLIRKLNRPILYEIEREDEEFASLTIGHIRHVQKHFHRSFRMLLSIKELVKSISKRNNAYNAIEFENAWYSLYHNHFDQNFAIKQFKLMAENSHDFVRLSDACNNVDEQGKPMIVINDLYPRRKLQLGAVPYPSFEFPFQEFEEDEHICYINCMCDFYPEMQSATCTTITFEKSPKKPKKPKKPSNQERLLMLKANKIADQFRKTVRLRL